MTESRDGLHGPDRQLPRESRRFAASTSPRKPYQQPSTVGQDARPGIFITRNFVQRQSGKRRSSESQDITRECSCHQPRTRHAARKLAGRSASTTNFSSVKSLVRPSARLVDLKQIAHQRYSKRTATVNRPSGPSTGTEDRAGRVLLPGWLMSMLCLVAHRARMAVEGAARILDADADGQRSRRAAALISSWVCQAVVDAAVRLPPLHEGRHSSQHVQSQTRTAPAIAPTPHVAGHRSTAS